MLAIIGEFVVVINSKSVSIEK